MKISELKMDYGYNGKGIATTWVTLYSTQDVAELIAWLHIVKSNMEKWEKRHGDWVPN